MAIVAPSILSSDFTNLEREFEWMEKIEVPYAHIDVMDGHYVPNLTFGPPIIKSLREISDLIFDVHLMIQNPENSIDAYIDAGADILTFHLDATTHVHRLVHRIKERGVKVGISLNPHESPKDLKYILEDLDQVLLMSVNPGFGGQKFISSTIKKVSELSQMIDKTGKEINIEVDGGVNDKIGHQLVDAGANILVAGSYIFKSDNRDAAVKSLEVLK